MPDYSEILYGEAAGVASITLNRPDKLNAWTPTMADEVRNAVGVAGNAPEVRCIIVTGAGRGFCAGADMTILDDTAEAGAGSAATVLYPDDVAFPNAPGPAIEGLFSGRFTYLYSCPKPVIAAINGPCVGMGLIFALYCDFRFAARDAVLSTAFAARGLIAEHGLAWLLPRMIGETRALDLLMTARKFDGLEAAQMGLVTAAYPQAELMEQVTRMARNMADNISPRSAAIIKRQVRLGYVQELADALVLANEEMAESFKASDFKEGVRSFVERRPPRFADISGPGAGCFRLFGRANAASGPAGT